MIKVIGGGRKREKQTFQVSLSLNMEALCNPATIAITALKLCSALDSYSRPSHIHIHFHIQTYKQYTHNVHIYPNIIIGGNFSESVGNRKRGKRNAADWESKQRNKGGRKEKETQRERGRGREGERERRREGISKQKNREGGERKSEKQKGEGEERRGKARKGKETRGEERERERKRTSAITIKRCRMTALSFVFSVLRISEEVQLQMVLN